MLKQLTDDSWPDSIDLRPDDGWIIRQLDAMYEKHHITQRPGEFVNEPGKPRTDHIHTGWSALSGDTARAGRTVRRHLGPDCAVLGAVGRRPNASRRVAQFDLAHVIALPEGDPHALQQFIEALGYLGMSEPRPDARWPKQLVVTNLDFYRPFFEGVFGPVPRGAIACDFYERAISARIGDGARSRVEVVVVDALEQVPSNTQHAQPASDRTSSLVTREERPLAVTTLFFGSTKEKKADYWSHALGAYGVTMPSLMQIVDELGDPAERHRSYVANARGVPAPTGANSGKAEAFITAIRQVMARERGRLPSGTHQLTRHEFVGRLRQGFGIDVSLDKVTFLVDDSGLEFRDWPQLKPYFPSTLKEEIFAEIDRRIGYDDLRGIRGQDDTVQSVPGVETAWWVNKLGGVRELLRLFADACEQYAKEHGEPLPSRITSVCAATLVEMDLSKPDAPVRVRNYTGTTTYAFRRPGPDDDHDDSFSWCVPLDDATRDDATSVAARLANGADGSYVRDLPWMKAIDAMRASGVQFGKRPVPRVLNYRVDVIGSADAPASARQYQNHVRALTAAQRDVTRDAAPIVSVAEPPMPASPQSMTTPAGADSRAHFDPYEFDHKLHDNDAFVFASTPDSLLGRSQFLYSLYSALVATNMHPEHKGKLLLINRDDPGTLAALDISQTLLAHGLSEDWKLLARPFASEAGLREALGKHWSDYRRMPGTVDLVLDRFDMRRALAQTRPGEKERPIVGVFCSARSVVAQWQLEAHAVAKLLAREGIDLAYGGGAKGLMSEVATHHRDVAAALGSGARVAGISTPMVVGKETSTGRLPDWLEVGYNAPNIVRRMEILLGADHFIVLKGGDGTVQEVTMALGLKAAGDALMNNKRTIILNAPTTSGSRVYDSLIAFYGPLDAAPEQRLRVGRERLRDELDVHVLESSGADLTNDLARLLGIARR